MTTENQAHQEAFSGLSPRANSAVTELEAMIRARYPSASFTISYDPDDAEAVHLMAVVDIEDTDEVIDLVIERVLSLQLEEGLPISVIPLRTPERVVWMPRRQEVLGHAPVLSPPPRYWLR